MKKNYPSLFNHFCFFVVLFLIPKPGFTQISFTTWHHPPYVTLYATVTGTGGINHPTNIYEDDAYSDSIDMGFNFNFYGGTYSQCVIGANGNLTFDLSLSNLYDDWQVIYPLLGNSGLLNNICGPYCDMDIFYTGVDGGQIDYFTAGVSPNRKFVVNFCKNIMFGCSDVSTSTQIILYENTNQIEVHISNKPYCTWNDNRAIVGVQNASGTNATVAPGRDQTDSWSASNESWQFSPDSSFSSYIVTSIPYAPIPSYTVYWFDSSTGWSLGYGDSIVIIPSGAEIYQGVALSCNDTVSEGYVSLIPEQITPADRETYLTIYPNPTQSGLNISSAGLINSVEVYDMLGRRIIGQKFQSRTVQLSTSQLSSGVYLAKVNGIIVKQFVKE